MGRLGIDQANSNTAQDCLILLAWDGNCPARPLSSKSSRLRRFSSVIAIGFASRARQKAENINLAADRLELLALGGQGLWIEMLFSDLAVDTR
jgi:hypothetical protein